MHIEKIEHMFYNFRRAFSVNLLTETQYIGRWFYGRNKRILQGRNRKANWRNGY